MAEFKYNHDLLLDPVDLAVAKKEFPNVFPALDHEVLRSEFKRHDKIANDTKDLSRRLGFWAVALVSLALLVASAAHLFEHRAYAPYLAGSSALAGIVGAILALGAVYARSRSDWLLHRFATERLRQFYFQSFVALGPEILEAAGTGDWTKFHSRREAAFSRLLSQLKDEPQVRFDLALGDDIKGLAPADVWLLQPESTMAAKPPPAMAEWKRAYRLYRLDGQRAFAQHKLDNRGKWLSRPLRQMTTLRTLSGIVIGTVVVLHIAVAGLVAGGGLVHPEEWVMPTLHLFAVWLAIVALAVRALDEGLQPGREIERYRAYRDATRNLLRRFDEGGPPRRTQGLMRAMEELSYDEMVSFLKLYVEARFAM